MRNGTINEKTDRQYCFRTLVCDRGKITAAAGTFKKTAEKTSAGTGRKKKKLLTEQTATIDSPTCPRRIPINYHNAYMVHIYGIRHCDRPWRQRYLCLYFIRRVGESSANNGKTFKCNIKTTVQSFIRAAPKTGLSPRLVRRPPRNPPFVTWICSFFFFFFTRKYYYY